MKKVLLVEDERILAITLRFELQQLGYEVIGMASNSTDALSLAQANRPDFVIMDISIDGELDGVETAIAMANVCDAPVIYLTGESDAATRQRAMQTPNAHAYLTKPGDVRRIEQELQQARNGVARPQAAVA